MFGYTLPMYPRLSAGDLEDYRRYYCEACHELRDSFGFISTAAVNYDMTFNTIILNSIYGEIKEFEYTKTSLCVFRGPYAKSDLMQRMAGYTMLLTKWELVDDEYDKPSPKTKLISLAMNRAINKAEKMYPEYDEIVGEGYGKLREMELDGCTDAVKMGTEFGKALSRPLDDISGGNFNGHTADLFAHLTSIVYIMDAIDDLNDDYLDGTYNPFLVRYSDFMETRGGQDAAYEDLICNTDCCSKNFKNRDDFVNENLYEITGTMNSAIGELQNSYSYVRKEMESCVGVTDNIVMLGIPETAKNVLMGRSNAKSSVKNSLNRRKAGKKSN